MRIDSGGRVIIGATSANEEGNEYNLCIQSNSSSTQSYGGLMLRRGQGSISDNNSLGRIFFGNSNGNCGARISALGAGTWGTDDYPGKIQFDTVEDGTNSYVTRLQIEDTGQVVVGDISNTNFNTVSSTRALCVVDTSNGGTLQLRGGSPKLVFDNTGGGAGYIYQDSQNLTFIHGTPTSVGNGVLTRLLAGGGIAFNGDTAQANALDDYEEGTWTPTAVTGTLSSIKAIYTKVGRVVTLSAVINNFSDRTSTNQLRISGLPFTDGDSHSTSVGSMFGRYIDHNYSTIHLSNDSLYFYGVSSGNYLYLQHDDLNASDATIYLHATYMTA